MLVDGPGLRFLTGQLFAACQMLAGHTNKSGAVYNLQAVFCMGLA